MEQVAAEAGVALKTVYVVFVTKSGLLRALWDLRLKGDQAEAAVAERPWYREVLEEPDPERQLRGNARNACIVKQRIAGMLKILRSAAPVDPDAEALWGLIQSDFYGNQRAIVESVHARQRLRPGLDVARATDILWTLNHPDVWLLLVGERGWTPEQWERWFADTACAQLLGHPPPGA
jgi:AcrR family transcriptional regulator